MRVDNPLFEMGVGAATAALLGASIVLLLRFGATPTDILPFLGAFLGAGVTALLSIWSARFIEASRYREDARRTAASLRIARPLIADLTAAPVEGDDFVARRIAVAEEEWLSVMSELQYAIDERTNLTWSQRAKVSLVRSSLGWLWDMRTGVARPVGEVPRTVAIVVREIDEALIELER